MLVKHGSNLMMMRLKMIKNLCLYINTCKTTKQNVLQQIFKGGDVFKPLSWEGYKAERVKDGNFTEREKKYFDDVIGYFVSSDAAKSFSPQWED